MNFTFDNDRPIYIQLVEQLAICIISGKFKRGEKIPSVRELAIKTRVNPNTMQKALAELESKKLIFTERTNGKFVTNDIFIIEQVKQDFANKKVRQFLNDMDKLGLSYEEICDYLKNKGDR